jgi:HEAT repeat protein
MDTALPDATMPQAGLRKALSELEALRGRADEGALAALLKALDSEYQSVGRRAAELLADLREPAVKLIQQQFPSLTDSQRGFALFVVARVLGEGALPWLRGKYQSAAGPMRASVIQAVSEIPGNDAVEMLIGALGDESWLTR